LRRLGESRRGGKNECGTQQIPGKKTANSADSYQIIYSHKISSNFKFILGDVR
jgi:hypothetical protein